MAWFNRKPTETRESIQQILERGGSLNDLVRVIDAADSGVDIVVSVERAFGVPALGAAIRFLSNSLAQLPLEVYKNYDRMDTVFAKTLSRMPYPGVSSYKWRRHKWRQVFTEGRSVSLILRGDSERIIGFQPTDIRQVSIKRVNGRLEYTVGTTVYSEEQVIDLTWDLQTDFTQHISPIMSSKLFVAMILALQMYGLRFFNKGGVPPFALIGPHKTAGAVQRAVKQLITAIVRIAQDRGLILPVPEGFDLKPLAAGPVDAQYDELQKSLVIEASRLFQLPPFFLQVLSTGTYRNAEQQDLSLVKHTLSGWATQFEQELNVKCLGMYSEREIRHDLDELMRGDLKTRSEAHARLIASGLRTPNELRELARLKPIPHGDKAYIQGAMVPLENAGEVQPQNEPQNEPSEEDETEEEQEGVAEE